MTEVSNLSRVHRNEKSVKLVDICFSRPTSAAVRRKSCSDPHASLYLCPVSRDHTNGKEASKTISGNSESIGNPRRNLHHVSCMQLKDTQPSCPGRLLHSPNSHSQSFSGYVGSYRPNSSHQYLSPVDLRDATVHEADLRLGYPTRTTLLRARQRRKSAPPTPQGRETPDRKLSQKMPAPSYGTVNNLLNMMMSDGSQSLHGFITGARYNRSNFIGRLGSTEHNSYLSQQSTVRLPTAVPQNSQADVSAAPLETTEASIPSPSACSNATAAAATDEQLDLYVCGNDDGSSSSSSVSDGGLDSCRDDLISLKLDNSATTTTVRPTSALRRSGFFQPDRTDVVDSDDDGRQVDSQPTDTRQQGSKWVRPHSSKVPRSETVYFDNDEPEAGRRRPRTARFMSSRRAVLNSPAEHVSRTTPSSSVTSMEHVGLAVTGAQPPAAAALHSSWSSSIDNDVHAVVVEFAAENETFDQLENSMNSD